MSSGLTMTWRQVDVLVDLALGGLEAVLELGDPLLEQGDAGLGLVGAAGAGDLGVAELALEGREEVERVAAPVGPGDLPFLLAEEDGILGLEVGVELPSLVRRSRPSGRRSGRRNRRRRAGSGGSGCSRASPRRRTGPRPSRPGPCCSPAGSATAPRTGRRTGPASVGPSALYLASRSRIRSAWSIENRLMVDLGLADHVGLERP